MDSVEFDILLWDKNLETGVPEIDKQHRELIEKIKEMVAAIANQQGKEKVEQLVYFLSAYVYTHFDTESNYMQNNKYPHAEDHMKEHSIFLEKVKLMEEKFLLDGPSRQLAAEIANELWGWFKDHICKHDKKLGVFLKIRIAQANRLKESTS